MFKLKLFVNYSRLRQLQLPSANLQQGVSLIEVLVSILVLSLGLLGMMGMQVGSLRFEQGSWIRAAVSASVADFSDGIRMLPQAAASDIESTNTYASELAKSIKSSYFVPKVDCTSNNCTAAQFAEYYRVTWRKSLHDNLPAAVGFIDAQGNGGANLRYVITIAWADKSLVNDAGVLQKAPVCSGTEVGSAARNCCPAAISAPAGVRCTSLVVLP